MDRLVSVIIPTHHGSDVVCKAVDSVLMQTYPYIEVIVVDDNGLNSIEQQKTENLMRKYKDDSRVKYIVHEICRNGSAARNTGIKNCSGEYIAFLDDDDVYLPQNIQKHMDVWEELDNDYGITYCGMKLVRIGMKEQIVLPSYEGDCLYPFFLQKITIGSSLLVVKKSVVDDVGGFDESFKRHQDWEFIARILVNFKLAKVSSIGVEKHNLNRNSARNPEKSEEYRMHYLNKMKNIINTLNLEEQRKVYDAQFFIISKEYFKAGKIGKCFKWLKKTSCPIHNMFLIVRSGINYINRKS